MKPNILLAYKKYFLPPAKTVPGQLPRGKLSPYKTSPNPNANPNPNPNRGHFLFGESKAKETKNRKEIKNNRRKKKEIKQKTLIFKLEQTFPKTRT